MSDDTLRTRIIGEVFFAPQREGDEVDCAARATDRIIQLVREALLSDAAVEAALIQFMADSSFIDAESVRQQWWNRLKDEPEHGEDFSDSKYLYREAMRSGMIAALALDAVGLGGDGHE